MDLGLKKREDTSSLGEAIITPVWLMGSMVFFGWLYVQMPEPFKWFFLLTDEVHWSIGGILQILFGSLFFLPATWCITKEIIYNALVFFEVIPVKFESAHERNI